jgi:hypothetical protein
MGAFGGIKKVHKAVTKQGTNVAKFKPVTRHSIQEFNRDIGLKKDSAPQMVEPGMSYAPPPDPMYEDPYAMARYRPMMFYGRAGDN